MRVSVAEFTVVEALAIFIDADTTIKRVQIGP